LSLASKARRARPVKRASDGRRHSVRVVEVGASLLSALGRLGGSASLSELCGVVRLPLSKAHRYLKGLVGSGFVEQDAVSGHYRLGIEALRLGLAAVAGIDVVSVATARIAALSAQVDETILLSIWANQGATVVHVKEPLRHVTVVTRIGSVLPLHSSATGLVFAAHLAAAAPGAGRRASKRAAALEQRLSEVRAHGLAVVHGLFFPGIDAVAAPVYDAAGRLAAVITVLGPAAGFDASIGGRIARQVAAAAADVSTRLGYPAKAARTRSKSSGVSTPAGGGCVSATR
jgi:DNA-binding IclR family transcriptional regulator